MSLTHHTSWNGLPMADAPKRISLDKLIQGAERRPEDILVPGKIVIYNQHYGVVCQSSSGPLLSSYCRSQVAINRLSALQKSTQVMVRP